MNGVVSGGAVPPCPRRWLRAGLSALAALLWVPGMLTAATVKLTPESPALNLTSATAEVTVSAAGIPGWQAKVPKGQSASFRYDTTRALIDIATPAGNQEPVEVRLPDGALAQLGTESAARFDWFKDQTYYFSGNGKVSAKSKAGVSSVLSGYFLPMTGGVAEPDSDDKNPRRRSPLVMVHVLADSGKDLHVRMDKQEVHVKRGEVKQITHPNGSILQLSYDEKWERLRWKVIKGFFEFDIPETKCWRAYTVTDQEGGLRHEGGTQGADVVNLSPENIVKPNENILADLHHNVAASVHRQADFHYRQREDCAHYDASSKGGIVDLSRPVAPGADQAGDFPGGSAIVPGLYGSFLWSLRIGDKDSVFVGLNDTKQIADFKTGAGNGSPLVLRLPDGGRAEIGDNSTARLDVLKNLSYYLAGTGAVTAANADGQKFVLNPFQPPLTGGPFVDTVDANGVSHSTQLSPVTQVKVTGQLGDELVVQVGGQTVTVPTDGSRTVTLPNGTVLTLTQSASARTLTWEADKGYVQVKVEGTGRWQAEGLTGQSASMQWNNRDDLGLPGQIDIKNLSGNSPLLIDLPGRNFASVTPTATLQFAQGTGQQYFVTAGGGDVVMFNPRLGTQTLLHPGDPTLSAGGQNANVSGLNRQAVTVFGDEEQATRVTGESSTESLLNKVERVVLFGQGDTELTIQQPSKGTLVLESTTGDHVVTLQSLSGWNIDLPEGNKITWIIDVRRGIITATTSPENSASVSITTPDGFTPVMPPDTTITFIVDKAGALASASGFGKLPVQDLTTAIREPIIVQPPVSVVK